MRKSSDLDLWGLQTSNDLKLFVAKIKLNVFVVSSRHVEEFLSTKVGPFKKLRMGFVQREFWLENFMRFAFSAKSGNCY